MVRSLPLVLCALTFSFGLCAQDESSNRSVAAPTPATVAENVSASWQRLQSAATAHSADTRATAIRALSMLGGSAQAEQIVRSALSDTDIDVRLDAIVAAGEMSASHGARSNFPNELRRLLDNDDPKISFTAAATLWKLNDDSGEDILIAVAQKERTADYGLWKRSRINAGRTLHSPSSLSKIAATQGLLIVVPPVGIGMGAYTYLSGAGGASPQVSSVTLLGQRHSAVIQNALIAITQSKDTGARVAAAEELGQYPDATTSAALEPLLTDSKQAVSLTASAAYLRIHDMPRPQPSKIPRKQ